MSSEENCSMSFNLPPRIRKGDHTPSVCAVQFLSAAARSKARSSVKFHAAPVPLAAPNSGQVSGQRLPRASKRGEQQSREKAAALEKGEGRRAGRCGLRSPARAPSQTRRVAPRHRGPGSKQGPDAVLHALACTEASEEEVSKVVVRSAETQRDQAENRGEADTSTIMVCATRRSRCLQGFLRERPNDATGTRRYPRCSSCADRNRSIVYRNGDYSTYPAAATTTEKRSRQLQISVRSAGARSRGLDRLCQASAAHATTWPDCW